MPRPLPRLPAARAMVVAPQPDAVEAGVEALRAGGTAIEAVLACAFVQGVVDPLMCGIGGLGVLQVFDPRTRRHEVIDGLSTVPGAATPEMWAAQFRGECPDGYGYIVEGFQNEKGHGAVTTPGILRVFEAAHRDYGRLPWADLLQPAIGRAREGWAVRPHVHAMFTLDEAASGRCAYAEKLAFTDEGRALYMEDGAPKQLGRIVRNPGLADSLELIAAEGVEAFYAGALADAITADMAAHGGLLSAADLRGFRVRREAPLSVMYRGRSVAVPAPPAGGVVIAEMLRILERFDLVALGHNSAEYVRVIAEAMKIAGADKERFIGDPDFLPPPLDRLLGEAYADECAVRIKSGAKTSLPRVMADAKGTTTVSAWDADGMVATLTHTLGVPSGVIPPGTGFMLNGAMNWYDPRPGGPNSIAPGKRRFSSMAPTIVFEGDTPVMTIGAPGGAWIGVAILQGLLNVLDWGMGMQAAVMAPRFSATSDAIDISNRIPRAVEREVAAMGYEMRRAAVGFAFAGLHGILNWDGVLDGGADPQRDGYVGVVN